MRPRLKISSLLLALVVFISATGHVFMIHYCSMEGVNKKGSCCCKELHERKGDAIERDAACCFSAVNYLINPFVVRQPESLVAKINLVAKEMKLYCFNFDNYTGIHYLKKEFTVNNAPPGQADLLTLISTFQI